MMNGPPRVPSAVPLAMAYTINAIPTGNHSHHRLNIHRRRVAVSFDMALVTPVVGADWRARAPLLAPGMVNEPEREQDRGQDAQQHDEHDPPG